MLKMEFLHLGRATFRKYWRKFRVSAFGSWQMQSGQDIIAEEPHTPH